MEQMMPSAHEIDPHDVWFRQQVTRTLAKGQRGEAHFSGHEEVFQQLKQYARQWAVSPHRRIKQSH